MRGIPPAPAAFIMWWIHLSTTESPFPHPKRASSAESVSISSTLHSEYRVVGNRYSRLLFTSEGQLYASFLLQEQSEYMTSQYQYLVFAWRHGTSVLTSQCKVSNSRWVMHYSMSWCLDDIGAFVMVVNEKLLFWFKFHLSLFPRVQLTITQHWFR